MNDKDRVLELRKKYRNSLTSNQVRGIIKNNKDTF